MFEPAAGAPSIYKEEAFVQVTLLLVAANVKVTDSYESDTSNQCQITPFTTFIDTSAYRYI